jgi:glycerophosphoryl diester phosphodiesterase
MRMPAFRVPLPAPAWLTARPIAHRGFHAIGAGIVENTLAAAQRAIDHDFAIECDVQCTRDGEAIVFHDFSLDRLTLATGLVADHTAAALGEIGFRAGHDRIVPLARLLALIGGRVPLVCEIKSRFDGDMRLAERAVEVVRGYGGPVALKSFDPAVLAHLRALPTLLSDPRPVGVVAEATYVDPEWDFLSPAQKFELANFLHYRETRPDFVSYAVDDLPRAAPFLCREALGIPIMAWTVRSPEQRRAAAAHADQMVFETFTP